MKLTLADIQFLFEQVSLPGNDPRNGPFGNVPGAELLPLGIRDTQGLGNNPYNSNYGNADQFFVRETTARYINANGTVASPSPNINMATRTVNSDNIPVSYAKRDIDIVDNAPRVISNLVANQSSAALSAIGYTDPQQQRLVVLDNPADTPGGRLNPLTGNMNPLPYSTFTALFGQFFDHGLDFVHKGQDGTVYVNLAEGDSLYNKPGNPLNLMMASRSNTTHVNIGASSTDNLVNAFGFTSTDIINGNETRYTEANSNLDIVNGVAKLTGGLTTTPIVTGTLLLNNIAIDIDRNWSTNQILDAINAKSSSTGITALTENGRWVFSYTVGESINTVSPFIDLSQSYGSVGSHTAFVREYTDNNLITGNLVSGNGAVGAEGMATWEGIKANAARVGVILHDKDVTDIPEVRLLANGEPFLGTGVQDGMWLVARHEVTGAIYYVKDSYIAGNGAGEVLDQNGAVVTNNLQAVVNNLILQTVGHAFLDDMAHGVLDKKYLSASGDLVPLTENEFNAVRTTVFIDQRSNPLYADYNAYLTAINGKSELLNAHYIAGDGRVNENFGLTTIHDVFHAEHNRVLAELLSNMIDNGDGTYTKTYPDNTTQVWTGEMLFQAAKLVTEMEYQHLVFGEFARKLSPHIGAFVSYDVTIDPAISAEFANSVYRFGHSMLTEKVSAYDANGTDKTYDLLDAFLNPKAYGLTNEGLSTDPQVVTNGNVTAGDVARGMSNQVANAIDEWMTEALRDNLVGLPLDLATLNIVRGRDAGIGSLNDVRADLYAQTGLSILRPYVSWDDFGQHLLHHESLENFIMAYADLTKFATDNPTSDLANFITTHPTATLREAAQAAMADADFMNNEQSFNNIDLWIGGLAEQKVTGGMLGSTFDFLFAKQMDNLQNGDRFYYLSRLVGTDLLAEIEGQFFSDIVMRNTDATHLYSDIFSVADATVDGVTDTQTSVNAQGATVPVDLATANTVAELEALNQAGWVNGVLYGNPGDYYDARGVLNPNGHGNASEIIIGTDNADQINGLGGNDTIWADAGNDTVEGGAGNDFLHGGDGNDVLNDVDGDNFIWGNAGNDLIRGGVGLDSLFGNDGNDTIYGGAGGLGDIIDGGAGNDVIYGDNGIMVGGIVRDSNGENDVITAGEGNDLIYGGGGADAIDAGEGNDIVYGGLGADAMVGLGGNDLFVMDPTENGVDIAAANSIDGGLGFDTVDYSSSSRSVNISLTNVNAFPPNIPAPVADIFLAVEGARGSAFNDNISAVANALTGVGVVLDGFGVPVNTGTTLAPIYTAMDFHLEGLAGNDTLTTGDGNDTLDGGTGTDSMVGGAGNDTYVVSVQNDVIVELALGGNDTVQSSISYSILGTPELENITLTGSVNITATGNALDNVIRGDTNTAANNLRGGAGNDTYYVDSIDTITENANAGTDLVFATANYTLGNNVENLTLIGAALTGTGNTLNNLIIGNELNNTLTGNAGNDTLDGGLGIDTLIGGAGDDTYIVDSASDVITENAAAGTDTVIASVDYTLTNNNVENLTLAAGALVGTGNTAANIITGNIDANTLSGANGNDTLNGGAGDDTLNGGNDNDVLNGEAGNDVLNGDAGNDTLNGGAGADTLNGGGGNDVFRFASTADLGATVQLADVIQDFASGTDKIDLTGFDGNTGTAGVQELTWIGTDAFTAVGQVRISGNTLQFNTGGNNNADFVINMNTSNVVASDITGVVNGAGGVINGNGAANNLTGTGGSDTMNGLGSNDTLTGGLGADTLTGGAGADRFRYTTVNEVLGDIITDFKAGGADRIDFATIDANGAGAGNTAFSFIGTNTFSAAGQLRYAQLGGNTYIEGSTNADTVAEFTLVLQGYNGPIVAGDFFL